jgi:F-type H+-transporting ATPase subunit epsilon
MSAMLHLNILSPERKLVSDLKVMSVLLTTSEGQIEILPGHAAMMGQIMTGSLAYTGATTGSAAGVASVSTGFFEVSHNAVTILAETIELKNEIDLGRAKVAQQKAEKILGEAQLDDHQFRKYELKLQRALIRQRVGSTN